MKMKKIVALLLALVMAFSLVACGNSGGSGESSEPADRNGDGKVTIAYSAIGYSIAVLPQYLHDNLKAECEERGWEFIFLAAEGDAMLQGEQVSQLVQQDPDYFLMMPADPALAVDWVNEVNEAGIPCITVHTDVADELAAAHCGPDNYARAAALAKELIDKHGADAGLKIVEIGGVPVQSDYILRVAGFDEYIKANSNYEILGIEWAYSNRADAQGYMENFISTYGDEIDVLMGFDDDLTLGGVNALQAAGMTDVEVYSITGQIEAMAALKAGTMTMTAFYRTALTASNAFDCIEKLAAGEEIEYFHYTEVPNLTIDNVADYEAEGEF